jgi:hypothetical protein
MTGGPPLASGAMASDGVTTPVRLSPVQLEPVDKQVLCSAMCQCDKLPGSPYKQGISYDMTQSPPAPIMERGLATKGHSYLPGWIGKYWATAPAHSPSFKAGQGLIRRPDVVIIKDPSRPPTQDNIKQIIAMKFPPDALSDRQKRAYRTIAGDPDKLLVLEPNDCHCDVPEPRPLLPAF